MRGDNGRREKTPGPGEKPEGKDTIKRSGTKYEMPQGLVAPEGGGRPKKKVPKLTDGAGQPKGGVGGCPPKTRKARPKTITGVAGSEHVKTTGGVTPCRAGKTIRLRGKTPWGWKGGGRWRPDQSTRKLKGTKKTKSNSGPSIRRESPRGGENRLGEGRGQEGKGGTKLKKNWKVADSFRGRLACARGKHCYQKESDQLTFREGAGSRVLGTDHPRAQKAKHFMWVEKKA